MADKAISELSAAASVTNADLFLLEQGGEAKKIYGQTLIAWLLQMMDGHGGIQSIDKTAAVGLVDTYTVTYADGSTQTFNVTNGAQGVKGDNAYFHIKFASQQPTEASHSMGDIPDDWIGVYSGSSASAPTDWTAYKWFNWKGQPGESIRGETGATPVLQIGTVTTVSPDQKASAAITGTAENPVLNLSIPRGYDGPSGAGAPDWALNGVNQDGFILNRTHYVESEERLITAESIAVGSDGKAVLSLTLSAEAGKEYKVNWSDLTYTCQMRDVSHLGLGAQYAFGNLSMLDASYADSGEPFVIVYYSTLMKVEIRAADYADRTVPFELYNAEVVRKLDNKFIDAVWMATKRVSGSTGLIFAEESILFTGNQAYVTGLSVDSFEPGGMYTVYWNGTAYVCECYVDSDGAYGLGNSALAGLADATDDPFYITGFGGTGVFVYKEADSTETVTLRITGAAVEEYEKLPEEFLPESVESVVLRSPNGSKFKLTVSDSGAITTTAVT